MSCFRSAYHAALQQMHKKQDGAVTLEWVFLFPIMVLIMLVIFWVFCLSVSYIYMNNLCNDIAQDMNVGKVGTQIAVAASGSIPDSPVKTKSYNGGGADDWSVKTVPTSYYGPSIVKALGKYYLYAYANPGSLSSQVIAGNGVGSTHVSTSQGVTDNRFNAGFLGAELTRIQISATLNGSYNMDVSQGRLPSGTKIHVQVQYTMMGLPVKANGYAIVT